jgi:hypothetical protein
VSKRQYSDNEKGAALAALDANDGNVSRTAKQLKIPRTTLLEWIADRHVSNDVSDIRQEKRKELSERLEDLAHTLVDILPDKLPAASVRDLAGALIVAVDKMQLLKGAPTAISKDVSERTNEERAARILELVRPAKTA